MRLITAKAMLIWTGLGQDGIGRKKFKRMDIWVPQNNTHYH